MDGYNVIRAVSSGLLRAKSLASSCWTRISKALLADRCHLLGESERPEATTIISPGEMNMLRLLQLQRTYRPGLIVGATGATLSSTPRSQASDLASLKKCQTGSYRCWAKNLPVQKYSK